MRHVTLPVVVVILVSFAGCAKPCFYQAGTSLEQCKHDLRACIDQARGQQKSEASKQIRSCMQAKGYECLDENKAPQSAKRIVVIAPFETYRVLGGLGSTAARDAIEAKQDDSAKRVEAGMVPDGSTAAAQEEPQESVAAEAPAVKKLGYRARLDANGRYVITPVYEGDLRKEADSAQ